MLGTLGYASLVAAFLGAAIGCWCGLKAGLDRTSGERVLRVCALAARRAAFFTFGAMSAAMLAMEAALLSHDFSVEYVSRVGSLETPAYYTAISLWSSLDGSILFWAWILSGFVALFAYSRRRDGTGSPLSGERGGLPHELRNTPLVVASCCIVGLFFYGLLLGPANPFGIVDPPPTNGPGPNPLLQNHPLMGLHPPMLYFGFVGMTVPFAFAVAGLIRGNVETRWLRESRRWMIAAWAFLTMGIIGGGWWSYEVLGWGGAWAWDPVENASLLPWLTATAFLHSSMVQEKRGMLKTWNLSLMIGTFLLTLFGTFLTRSGVLDSVHSFTEGVIGPIFLAFIALLSLASLALIGWRSDRLHAPGRIEGAVSRETAFLFNNLLLVGLTFTVLLGTMWPLVVEATSGDRISVGAPYFNQVSSPVGLALLFLMGIGPVLPWRRGAGAAARGALSRAGAAGAVVAAAALALGMREVIPVLTLLAAGFVICTIVEEFVRAIKARSLAGRSTVAAFLELFARSGRRYGGYVVHMGVVVIALAISVSWTWKTEREQTLFKGQRLAVGEYEIEFVELWTREEPHRFVVGASFDAYRGGSLLGRQDPRLNLYVRDPSQQLIATPAVASSLSSDLYLTLMAVDADNLEHATVKAIVNPGMAWLWAGGGIMGVGALLAIVPWGFRRRRAVPLE